MNIKEKAIKYYPYLWNLTMIERLVVDNKITEEDFYEITGVQYGN